MKVKRVKIGVRSPGTLFDEAAAVIGQIEVGKKVAARPGSTQNCARQNLRPLL